MSQGIEKCDEDLEWLCGGKAEENDQGFPSNVKVQLWIENINV